jgi:SAM-dependent methyltransferase
MPTDGADLNSTGTERSALAAQYKDPGNLHDRVSVYAYLDPEQPLPAGVTFEEWVLDHHRWTGNETTIDVGCGPGGYFAALDKRSVRTIGLDLSPGMVSSALHHNSATHVQAAVADIQMLPVKSGVVDVVVAAFMLYHVPDLHQALREVRRVLRAGGSLLAVTNGPGDKQEIRDHWERAGRRVLGPACSSGSTSTTARPCSATASR